MSDPCFYLNDPETWRAWVASWDSPGWSGNNYATKELKMLCNNCGCSEWEHRNTFCPDKVGNTYFTDMHYSSVKGEYLPQISKVTGNRIISDEVRITDPNTGGQKGPKVQRFSLIPADFLWALAKHYGIGATKYEDRNWEKGYKWSLSEDAYSRHFSQWKQGETRDEETGTHHLICAIWHLIALWWFDTHNKGTDDIRTKSMLT